MKYLIEVEDLGNGEFELALSNSEVRVQVVTSRPQGEVLKFMKEHKIAGKKGPKKGHTVTLPPI